MWFAGLIFSSSEHLNFQIKSVIGVVELSMSENQFPEVLYVSVITFFFFGVSFLKTSYNRTAFLMQSSDCFINNQLFKAAQS